jgi:glycosyltransferase involved in cell wall biosynthesis
LQISVVIPLYNKRVFVRDAVQSVLVQSHDLELIVVDDGSTDGSSEVLADIDDPRLRVVTQANGGVAAARNRGIEEARNPWVALLDADDLWRPTHLAEIAALIDLHADAGLVAATVQQTRAGQLLDRDQQGALRRRTIDYFAEAARNILVVHTSATALRKEVVLSVGGFRDLRPGQDIDCWSRIALDYPVVVSSKQTVLYSRDTGGAMHLWRAKRKSRDDIVRLEDFGGAIASLAQALDSGAYEHHRASIERYIDARILSGAGRCIATGDTANARRRLSFVHHQSKLRSQLRLLAALPAPIIRNGLALRRMLQRLRR